MSFLALQPSGSWLRGASRVGSTEVYGHTECTNIGAGGGVVENRTCVGWPDLSLRIFLLIFSSNWVVYFVRIVSFCRIFSGLQVSVFHFLVVSLSTTPHSGG